MALTLGIDIGTSSAKAVLYDVEQGAMVASAAREYPIHHPARDRAEQNPDDWWRAASAAVSEVIQAVNPAQVAAIGLTGQMHGTVLLNHDRKPFAPAIIWADRRTALISAEMARTIGPDRYAEIAGTLPAAGFMGPTLVWLKRQKPELLARTRRVVLPKDYVRLRLMGGVATDKSDASATGLFDVMHATWSDALIEAFGLPRRLFPSAVPSDAVVGELIPEAAAALGLRPGIPVVAGCADQPAQALANGLIAPGVASVTTGSGGQVFAPLMLRSPLPHDERLHVFNHAVPGMGYALGAILSAGLALKWLRGVTGLAGDPEAYRILSAEAATVPAGSDGLVFLPYLAGERTPHMDPHARGAFVGLTDTHTRGHLARAVMEGVSFALRQSLEICLSLAGPVESLVVSGGGAQSDVWRGIQADVFGLPLRMSTQPEQTATGAALLAAVGTGLYADFEEAVGAAVRFGPLTDPDPARQVIYNEQYAHFVELYPRLKDDFHRLAGK